MKRGVEHPKCLRLRRIKREREREALRALIYTAVGLMPKPEVNAPLAKRNRCSTFTHNCRIICLGRMEVEPNRHHLILGLIDYYQVRVNAREARMWDTPADRIEWANDIINGLKNNHEVRL